MARQSQVRGEQALPERGIHMGERTRKLAINTLFEISWSWILTLGSSLSLPGDESSDQCDVGIFTASNS